MEPYFRTRRRISILLGFILALSAIVGIDGGSHRERGPQSPPPKPHDHHTPGSIIGSETPDLIPRDVVLGLFLRTLNAAALQKQSERNYEKVYFDRMQRMTGGGVLADYDRKVLALAASAYMTETRGRTFSTRRAETVKQLSSWLTQTLTPSGKVVLERHLEQMKLTTKILK